MVILLCSWVFLHFFQGVLHKIASSVGFSSSQGSFVDEWPAAWTGIPNTCTFIEIRYPNIEEKF